MFAGRRSERGSSLLHRQAAGGGGGRRQPPPGAHSRRHGGLRGRELTGGHHGHSGHGGQEAPGTHGHRRGHGETSISVVAVPGPRLLRNLYTYFFPPLKCVMLI